MEKDVIVDKIIAKIKALPNGTETSMSQLMYDLLIIKEYDRNKAVYIGDNVEITNEDMFLIYKDVIKKIKNEKVFIDFSKYADQKIGLPFNIPFIKRTVLE